MRRNEMGSRDALRKQTKHQVRRWGRGSGLGMSRRGQSDACISLTRNRIHSHDLRVQIVRKRNNWKEQGQGADHGHRFEPRAGPRIGA